MFKPFCALLFIVKKEIHSRFVLVAWNLIMGRVLFLGRVPDNLLHVI